MTTPMFQQITREQLQSMLDRGEQFHFWCVLTQEWYKNTLIAGSKWVPLDKLTMRLPELGVKTEETIVVYCGGPQCPQSKQAAQQLVAKGYTNVYAYEGGLADWTEAGLPVTTA